MKKLKKMKIKHKFLLAFIILILLTLSINGYINFKTTENAVIQSALKTMEHDLDQTSSGIQAFHEKAGSELVFALNYPAFYEYFSLPETRAGNRHGRDNVIAFSANQKKLKAKLDEWAMFIQSRFPIAETCIIDRTGQEHSRITFQKIAPDDDFSNEENKAPFFEPTFRLRKGEFHVQYPYMSHDAKKWVFSYTSPIVLEDGSKPGIYHFEIPLSYFQELISKNTSGRTFVMDPQGVVVADSRQAINFDMKGGGHEDAEHSLKDYLPPVDSILPGGSFKAAISRISGGAGGNLTFSAGGETYYIVYKRLPAFNWSLVTIKTYSELLEGKSSLARIKEIVLLTVVLSLLAAAAVIYIISDKVTRPLLQLTGTAEDVSKGDLDVKLPDIRSEDEVGLLSRAMRDMVEGLRKIISKVEDAADRVTNASAEIKDESGSMYQGITAQANKSAQIATASEEMSNTVTEIARNTASIASTAAQATSLAEDGERIVARSVDEVKAIADLVEEISGSVKSLGERSSQIGEIVEVINDIAEQTKMLALNAAIEAARAGDQGRGFAVVADEVKRLSERTGNSTLQINNMIKSIQDEVQAAVTLIRKGTGKVEGGVEFSKQAGKALHGIVGSVKTLSAMVEQIATATNQLSNVSEQISSDIGAIASVSKSTSANTEQITRSTEALTELSEALQTTIKVFKKAA